MLIAVLLMMLWMPLAYSQVLNSAAPSQYPPAETLTAGDVILGLQGVNTRLPHTRGFSLAQLATYLGGGSSATFRSVSGTLTLPLIEGGLSPLVELATVEQALVVQVVVTDPNVGGVRNFNLYLVESPALESIFYQATGITDNTFTDNSPFFVPPTASGKIMALVANVDTTPATLNVTIKYMPLVAT
jgi:hypothetical protein